VNGKIQSFDCYPSGTVIFAQLGVLSNIHATQTEVHATQTKVHVTQTEVHAT